MMALIRRFVWRVVAWSASAEMPHCRPSAPTRLPLRRSCTPEFQQTNTDLNPTDIPDGRISSTHPAGTKHSRIGAPPRGQAAPLHRMSMAAH